MLLLIISEHAAPGELLLPEYMCAILDKLGGCSGSGGEGDK